MAPVDRRGVLARSKEAQVGANDRRDCALMPTTGRRVGQSECHMTFSSHADAPVRPRPHPIVKRLIAAISARRLWNNGPDQRASATRWIPLNLAACGGHQRHSSKSPSNSRARSAAHYDKLYDTDIGAPEAALGAATSNRLNRASGYLRQRSSVRLVGTAIAMRSCA